MASRASIAAPIDFAPPAAAARVYSVCCFTNGLVVPWVRLLDATSDEEAIKEARSLNRFSKRELWDRHRLVAVIPSE